MMVHATSAPTTEGAGQDILWTKVVHMNGSQSSTEGEYTLIKNGRESEDILDEESKVLCQRYDTQRRKTVFLEHILYRLCVEVRGRVFACQLCVNGIGIMVVLVSSGFLRFVRDSQLVFFRRKHQHNTTTLLVTSRHGLDVESADCDWRSSC